MFAVALPEVAAQGAILGHNTVARYIGRKGISLEGLPYGLGTTTTNALRQLGVCYGLARWYL